MNPLEEQLLMFDRYARQRLDRLNSKMASLLEECTELRAVIDEQKRVLALSRQRIIDNYDKFGEQWRKRGAQGNLNEAEEELADWHAYRCFAQSLLSAEG